MSTPQPKDEFVTLKGLKIHYLDWGNLDKQPLILLHGIARVAHCFDHVAPHFARRYHYPSDESPHDFLAIIDRFLLGTS